MKTLSEQLSELYAPLSPKLRMELQARGMKTKNEFVLSMALRPDREDPESLELEKWYTEADVKLMVFGQEAFNWGDMKDDGSDILDVQREYEKFYLKHYNHETGYFYTEGMYSPFFRYGINGIRSIFYDEIFVPPYEGKRLAIVWNNISKLSATDGRAVSSDVHAVEREFFHVIPREMEILKPDVVIFFTGPGQDSVYYRYILENFKQTAASETLGDIPMHDVEKMHLEGIKLAYKTYHPCARINHWPNYHAIEADIKANIEKILK